MLDLKRYFLTGQHKIDGELGARLWNPDADGPYVDEGSRAYQEAVLLQYLIYTEMADRLSQRRGAANTFFVTVNTGAFLLAAGFLQGEIDISTPLALVVTVALVTQCMTWFWILRSYRQLNAGKYAVIGELERKLPARPYSDGEWRFLGEGKDPSVYWPLSHVEAFVPLLFALVYLALLVVVAV